MAISWLSEPQYQARTPFSASGRAQKMSEMGTLPQATVPPAANALQHHSFQYSQDVHTTSSHHQPLTTPSTTNTEPSPGTAVRRRISKACDRCNQLRTKCDGRSPCKHCIDNHLRCEYVRERKKRGKASKKDLARMGAALGASDGSPEPAYRSNTQGTATSPSVETASDGTRHTFNPEHTLQGQPYRPMEFAWPNLANEDVHSMHGADNHVMMFGNEYGSMQDSQFSSNYGAAVMPNRPTWDERIFTMADPSMQTSTHNNGLRLHGDSMLMHLDNSRVDLPPRTNFSNVAPSSVPSQPSVHRGSNPSDLKYPVLRPLLPHIRNIIPLPLAFDLLEHYFSSLSAAYPHPRSPYIIAFVFSRRAFLRLDRPRLCSPALLASMLWISARTSDAKYLSASPASRSRVCQKLLELSVKLLRPLVHRPTQSSASLTLGAADDVSGTSVEDIEEPLDHDGVEQSANGTLDDVATYIHLGVVVSASEYKGASLRWWNAAWGLARELKLGRELPPDSTTSVRSSDFDASDSLHTVTQPVTEEEREERRRIWWLLYCMDRHLALCYNKPICLPDRECDTLLQPMDERAWQNGDFNCTFSADLARSQAHQNRGPSVIFTGPSLFGVFLPLMAILGEIIDLNHARTHPRFGSAFINAGLWDEQARIINLRLEEFQASIRVYEARHSSEAMYSAANSSPEQSQNHQSQMSFNGMAEASQDPRLAFEARMQQKKAIAYGTHIMHVLHILLTGRWDPIALLDDDDMWICSESFINATGHAVAAAEAAGEILEHDPEISFMPFLYGIYLLQGSFLLLLMADKLQRDADPNVIRACETIVRAHEACAVTLNTEYQRNFRKVMRSALSQVRGIAPPDLYGEEQRRRREVLSLYRWSGDGTGLNTE